MIENSILDIPTIKTVPFELKDITYNCPCCDYEIVIDIIVESNTSIKCDNCNHNILLKVIKI